MKPTLRAFVPCLDIQPDPGGTLHLRGVMQQIIVRRLPVVIELRAYIAWSDLSADGHEMLVKVTAPAADEPRVQTYALHPIAGEEVTFDQARDLWLREEIRAPGDMVFEVLLDGESHCSYRLPIVYQEPGPEPQINIPDAVDVNL